MYLLGAHQGRAVALEPSIRELWGMGVQDHEKKQFFTVTALRSFERHLKQVNKSGI